MGAAGAPGQAGLCRRAGGPGLCQAGRGRPARVAAAWGAGPGFGVPAQPPAGPWPPPASADSGEGAAPSLPGPGAPARSLPAWSLLPRSLPLSSSSSSLSPHFPSPPPPLGCPCLFSRPVPGLRSVCLFQPPRGRSRPLPAPAPGRLHPSPPLQAGGPSGWGSRGDKFGVFIILPPSNESQPSPEPAAGCLGASATPGLGLFGMGWQWERQPGSGTAA